MLPNPPRVVVYDGSKLQCELFSTGLKSMRPELSILCASDLESLHSLLTGDPACVLILSDGSINGSNIALSRRLRARFPELHFILLLQEGRLDRVIDAFRTGARGIVYSNENLDRLAQCVESVYRGEVWVRPTDLPRIFDALAKSNVRVVDVTGRALLSPREEEISRLVADGMSNREVSRALNISESTVKNSMFRIFEKLGISNRVELARYVSGGPEPEEPLAHCPGSISPAGTRARFG